MHERAGAQRGEPKGRDRKTAPVPGNTGATYAIELLPATGHKPATRPTSHTATASMLESMRPMKGTFRIHSTGFSGSAKVSIIATFKPASFLDYVYFTQLETSDPVTYGNEATIKGAYEQCSKTIQEGRYNDEIPNSGGKYCDTISFVSGDNIKGPMHTNDAFVICENPTLGRTPVTRSKSAPLRKAGTRPRIPHSGSNCKETNFAGTQGNSPFYTPPETNSQLASIAEPAFKYKGQVRICLSGTTMTVGNGKYMHGKELYSGPFPANGVVYV